MHRLPHERFLVQGRRAADAGEFPRADVREVVVVAQRFAFGRLALFAEVSATRFGPVQRIERQQLTELEVVPPVARSRAPG